MAVASAPFFLLPKFVFLFLLIALHKARAATSASKSLSSFVWLTDIHLDPTYDVETSGHHWCRRSFDAEGWADQQTQRSNDRTPYGPVWKGGVGGEGPRRPMTSELNPRDAKQKQQQDVLSLPAYWGRFGCDAPSQLVRHCFSSIVNETINRIQTQKSQFKPFVVVTGDSAAHFWESDAKEQRWKSLEAMTTLLLNLSQNLGLAFTRLISPIPPFPLIRQSSEMPDSATNAQVIITVGNNDLPRDYTMKENGHWGVKLWKMWSPVFIPATKLNEETFKRGLYYSTPIYSLPNVRAICLNTMWWARTYPWGESERPDDPAGQLGWLKDQLEEAEKLDEKVLILGHIPPGYSYFGDRAFSPEPQWFDDYEFEFLELVRQFQGLIIAQLFGHFHADDFRIQGFPKDRENDDISKAMIGATLLAPSIGTTHGNNPGWRLMELQIEEYDENDKNDKKEKEFISIPHFLEEFSVSNSSSSLKYSTSLLDYHQYVAYLHSSNPSNLGTYSRDHPPSFLVEYSFRDLYNETSASTTSIQAALLKIQNNLSLFKSFWTNHNTGGDQPAAFFLHCVQSVTRWKTMKECMEALVRRNKVNLTSELENNKLVIGETVLVM